MTIDEQTYRQIFERHRHRLHNLEVANPRFVVTFSAIAGAGKTTLAKALEKRYQAVRVSNDHVRQVIDELRLARNAAEKQDLLVGYVLKLFDFLAGQPNGLIVLDSSIDRKYFEVRDRVEPLGYRLVLINISLSRTEIERRVRQRPKSQADPDAYLVHFDRWLEDHRRLASRVQPDLVIADNYNYDFSSVYAYFDPLLDG